MYNGVKNREDVPQNKTSDYMSSILDKPAVREAAIPISVEQYRKLGEAGIIDEQTELLRGVIVRKMIKSPQHTWFVQKLVEMISKQIGTGYILRQEQPLSLVDSEPELGVAVILGSADDYRSHHPTTASLVIEVAVTSEELDREKTALYAESGVEEFWLVLVEKQCVEQFAHPSGSKYANLETKNFNSTLVSKALPEVAVDLSALK